MIELERQSCLVEGIPVYIKPGLVRPGEPKVFPIGETCGVRGLPPEMAKRARYAVFAHSMEDVRRAVEVLNAAATASGPPEYASTNVTDCHL